MTTLLRFLLGQGELALCSQRKHCEIGQFCERRRISPPSPSYVVLCASKDCIKAEIVSFLEMAIR